MAGDNKNKIIKKRKERGTHVYKKMGLRCGPLQIDFDSIWNLQALSLGTVSGRKDPSTNFILRDVAKVVTLNQIYIMNTWIFGVGW